MRQARAAPARAATTMGKKNVFARRRGVSVAVSIFLSVAVSIFVCVSGLVQSIVSI